MEPEREEKTELPTDLSAALQSHLDPAPDPESLRQWGKVLRRKREGCSLTRAQLGQMSGVSESTIRNLECGRHTPTRSVIMKLQAVRDLGLSPALPTTAEQKEQENTFSCNCWFAPEYDSIKMFGEMVQRLNGSGGQIEQTHLYIDPASAAAWCAITAQDAWARGKDLVPYRDVAQAVRSAVGEGPLDIIGLGSGEAKDEVKLTESLLGLNRGVHRMRLFLLEISQPLMSKGYRFAAEALGEFPELAIYGIQGNFHNLPAYTHLMCPRERRRLVCMFGYTFPNLDNEILFLRNSLCGFADGDLLLIDGPVAVASPEHPEEIWAKDPRLSKTLPHSSPMLERRVEEFLKGPFRRHVRGVRSVRLETTLDLASCPIPGSYAVDWRAHVRTDTTERSFSIYHSKRYNPELLDQQFEQLGWHLVQSWMYAPTDGGRLYQKRKASKGRSPATSSDETPTQDQAQGKNDHVQP